MDKSISDFVLYHPLFSTEDIFAMLEQKGSEFGRSTVYKYLNQMCEQNLISRTGRGTYSSNVGRKYDYPISDTAQKVSKQIKKKFPLVKFQIWELYQMNEFVNHLIAKNTIFIDVENMLAEAVFDFLFDKHKHVLYAPSAVEYYKYSAGETIVVKKLISETPAAEGEFNKATLEKILVDLFSKGITGSIIPRSEYRAIFEDSFKRYSINTAMMYRYARRRGCEDKIKTFLKEIGVKG